MRYIRRSLPGVIEMHPFKKGDDRGYFAEMWREDQFTEHAGARHFVQENQSLSARAGTVRGVHFQANPFAQGKLVRVLTGAIFDVAVDLRHDSPHFGQWIGVELSADAANQLWVPPGFGHGFCTLLPDTAVCYKITAYYSPEHDQGVAWDDPTLNIQWPELLDRKTLSAKDRVQPALAHLPPLFSVHDDMEEPGDA
ncbi:MAG: dTDP-4-dehydrorhamnose 3,5-epimerase [Sphingomonas bacterium]|uniref:dTDP-4-dehydrorhamnose 3,5-epimerase n=1 Tax=Sphingomonas bacterium TaxID=1895847 RepID=UPI00262B5FDF|nr:dTDP-4-dehydrorhamnose 3,5-epimerase [Sphingomonas bacterium]MDB5711826.1 dTDP-4-dehydrorhamnose 3,5-epimerase [Sphingomonas bacterium]